MQPDEPLQHLIDDCYAVFAPYPRPLAMHASPLRDPVALLKALSSAPLRKLAGEKIGPYAGYAMTTVGDAQDYKHFLPRILEQAIHDRSWFGTEPPIIAQRLKKAEWLDWPAREQAVIRALFIGAWSQALREHPDDEEADDWICGIACLNLDLTPMLELWLAEPSINAALQLAEFVQGGASRVFQEDVAERAFWNYANETKIRQLRRWLLSPPVHRLLQTARGRTATPRASRIDAALKALVSYSRTRLH